MDGWTDRRANGRMDGRTDAREHERVARDVLNRESLSRSDGKQLASSTTRQSPALARWSPSSVCERQSVALYHSQPVVGLDPPRAPCLPASLSLFLTRAHTRIFFLSLLSPLSTYQPLLHLHPEKDARTRGIRVHVCAPVCARARAQSFLMRRRAR